MLTCCATPAATSWRTTVTTPGRFKPTWASKYSEYNAVHGARTQSVQNFLARLGGLFRSDIVRPYRLSHLWPGLPNGVINPTVSPARISFTLEPLVIAWRKPTSKDSLSLTCQIAPTNPESVCARPNSSS